MREVVWVEGLRGGLSGWVGRMWLKATMVVLAEMEVNFVSWFQEFVLDSQSLRSPSLLIPTPAQKHCLHISLSYGDLPDTHCTILKTLYMYFHKTTTRRHIPEILYIMYSHFPIW